MKPPPILLRFPHGFFEISIAEYEQLKREVESRWFIGDTTLTDRIMAEMLLYSQDSYHHARSYSS